MPRSRNGFLRHKYFAASAAVLALSQARRGASSRVSLIKHLHMPRCGNRGSLKQGRVASSAMRAIAHTGIHTSSGIAFIHNRYVRRRQHSLLYCNFVAQAAIFAVAQSIFRAGGIIALKRYFVVSKGRYKLLGRKYLARHAP